ncbi:hypothetical protein Tco_0543680 [Tanacetum coccineum]
MNRKQKCRKRSTWGVRVSQLLFLLLHLSNGLETERYRRRWTFDGRRTLVNWCLDSSRSFIYSTKERRSKGDKKRSSRDQCKYGLIAKWKRLYASCAVNDLFVFDDVSIRNSQVSKMPFRKKPRDSLNCSFIDCCYLLNNYDDVGKLKEKGDIRIFVGYSKESAAFRVYNKRTRKIHESVNVNFDEISEMASKQFSLEPGLSNLNETGKYSNPTVSQV